MCKIDRSAGIFMPIFSLPSNQGIGCLGEETAQFCNEIASCGLRYWQICPLGPTGYGDSPYQTFSAFALNNYYIDVLEFIKNKWCSKKDIEPLVCLPKTHVDYCSLYSVFGNIIKKAFGNFIAGNDLTLIDEFGIFKREQRYWLDNYCLFMALKARFGGKSWLDWPEEFKNFDKIDIKKTSHELRYDIEVHSFAQWILDKQWRAIKRNANKNNLKIIGDIPIYVGLDSADVWANREMFLWDFEKNEPSLVAGVPPDYFSKNGQLWGNPIFNWNSLADGDYKWWLRRIARNLELFDIARLDHFRGFYDYWAVRYGAKTAKDGNWMPGPKWRLFERIMKEFSEMPFILEDLGDLNIGVVEFKEELRLFGMAILQFAFDGSPRNAYLPHNLKNGTVLYTGTHDNNTSVGWYNEASEASKDFCRRYLRVSGEAIAWDLIRAAYASVADLVIIPMQDFLSLDSSTRTNEPGTLCDKNWSWRITGEGFSDFMAKNKSYLLELAHIYAREL